MPCQVSEEIKKERSARLIALQDEIRNELLSAEVGKEYDVLFETKTDCFYTGHTPSFIEVSVVSDSPLQGEVRKVRIVEVFGGTCYGVLI